MSAMVGTAVFALGGVAGVSRSWWLFLVFLTSGALFVPLREGLQVSWAGCDVGVAPSQLAAAALNGPHVFLFGVLAIVALRVRRPGGRPLPTAAVVGLVLGFGLMLELGQGVFATGHCRVRDLLPDALGLAAALTLRDALRRARARASSIRA